MKKRMLIMLIIVGIIFGGIFGFQVFKAKMIKKYITAGGQPPVTVSTISASYSTWPLLIKSVGNLRAIKGVDVTTEIGGIVREINFKSGDQVKQGQVLLSLNDTAERAQLASLIANANLAQINYNRDKAQFDIQAVSKSVLDTDAANLENVKAQVSQQQAIIAKKNIQAPFDGVLGLSTINLGQYLNPGDKIVTLQLLDPIYVDFYCPQSNLDKLQKGQMVSIKAKPYTTVFQGKITTIDPKVDITTRNVLLEATIPNPQHKLLPGMFANIEVLINYERKFITVPQTAVTYNTYGETVFVVKESTNKEKPGLIAHQIPITSGEVRGDQIAIIKGLNEGDIVVTAGQLKIKNNSPVVINNKVVPSNNPITPTHDE